MRSVVRQHRVTTLLLFQEIVCRSELNIQQQFVLGRLEDDHLRYHLSMMLARIVLAQLQFPYDVPVKTLLLSRIRNDQPCTRGHDEWF